jgi:hypothetical protein
MRCGCCGGSYCRAAGSKPARNHYCCGVAVQTEGAGAPAPSLSQTQSGRAVHSLFVIVRIGRVGDLSPLGARSQCQHNEERGEPSVPVHCFLWATRSAVPNTRQRQVRSGSGRCFRRCRPAHSPASMSSLLPVPGRVDHSITSLRRPRVVPRIMAFVLSRSHQERVGRRHVPARREVRCGGIEKTSSISLTSEERRARPDMEQA